MDLKEFKKFIELEDKRMAYSFPVPDKEKKIFARIVKMSEEQGELSEAVLSYFSLQRKTKKQTGKDEVAHEIADVIICAGLLAYELEIDLEECLKYKMEKIKARKY
jgi:NTP pyrophosphatase (non-canonical NTP hydrolase)